MQITKIAITNFKGLRSAEFSPKRFSCLVGENNSGKSTVLQAITSALNRPPQMSPDLYYDHSSPIIFRVELGDIKESDLLRLAEEHRSKIADLVIDGSFVVIVKYNIGQKVEVKVERLEPLDPRYQTSTIADVFAGKKGGAVRKALEESYPEFVQGAPESLNISAAKDYLSTKINALPREQFSTAESPLPSGLSQSISALLPEPIYIPAVKNLADDLKTTQSTSFGRLLGLLLDDMEPDLANISASLQQLNSFFNRTEQEGNLADNRHEKVKLLEASVEGFLRENFPLAKVELRVPPPELRTILNAAQIFIDDGSKDLVDNKGDGIKRSLTFALLQCYVERLHRLNETDNRSRPLIFLFEEPELYLHPKSQRILFNTLERISKQFQVAVTTHSPLFFAPGATAVFVRVLKEAAEPKPVGRLHTVDFDLDAGSAEVFRMARFENADAAFFSRRVVLFEGESDDSYFKHVAKMLNPEWDFDVKNISLVRVSGKGNFGRFRDFFRRFGIEVKIVADLDAFFDGYNHLGVREAVAAEREEVIQIADGRIAALGIKAEPVGRQIKDKVTGASWKERYEQTKEALARVREGATVDDEMLDLFERLFVWEADIARGKVCKEDADARNALLRVLESMRSCGVHVLSRGAIEDYYPTETQKNGPKPERALDACRRVTTKEKAMALSDPLGGEQDPELMVICRDLFLNV
jgi:hypothetical protein